MNKRFTLLGLCLHLLILFPALGKAQEQTTLIAPFPPGGPVDTLARVLAQGLQQKYKKPVVVENVPGGAGNTGMDRVKRAKPDGYTLLIIPAGNLTINPTLMKSFPFVIERDFTPVTMLAKAPNVLVAGASSKIANLKDLSDQARAKPGAIIFGSPGIGSGLHLAGELFKQQMGIELQHVPYKGSPQALNDVLAGVIPLMFSNLPAALPHIRSGKLVALGLTDSSRTAVAADIPTLAELGVKDVVVTSWYGLMLPSNAAPETVKRLNDDVQEILGQASVQESLRSQGVNAVRMSPQDYAAHIKQETATWARIITQKNISQE